MSKLQGTQRTAKPKLLSTKLVPPRLPASLVSRELLLARLDEGLEHKLTLLSAPPGFGKTTLVSEWLAARSERPAVERKIAELSEHGAQQARYLGRLKNFLQAQWTGAVINLKRLFKLFPGDRVRMRQVLSALT